MACSRGASSAGNVADVQAVDVHGDRVGVVGVRRVGNKHRVAHEHTTQGGPPR